MHWPYSLDPSESFFAAQSCAALLLTALLLWARATSWMARGTMLLAVWLAAVAALVQPLLVSLGYKGEPDLLLRLLAASALLGAASCIVARRPLLAAGALVAGVPLWMLGRFVKESDPEVAALYLVWLGVLVGLLVRPDARRQVRGEERGVESSYRTHDTLVFVGATVCATLVSLVVMRFRDGVADEWGYTFQAAVFAKGHAYAQAPRCEPYLESMYVFESSGRVFSQYTPGWPLFLVPFFWLHALWLAGPASTGLMAVGMARLARSAVRLSATADSRPSARTIRVAGTWGAVLATVGPMILVNGGSRYPHVFVLGLYAWTLEAIVQVAAPRVSTRGQRAWGAVIGTAAVFAVAARPADGAFVGLGAAVLFGYQIARRRVGWNAFAAAAASTLLWSGIMLVILRLQLGKWFVTGYSLNATLHPWNVVKYSTPRPTEWKFGLPLATAGYCWWPCSISLGVAGLAMLRGRALGLVTAFVVGCVPYLVYTEFLDLGQRQQDWGYGPRYVMVLIVPLAVGGAFALAPLTVAALERRSAGRSALARGGPLALALFAVVSAWARIAPLVWPTVSTHLHRHAALQTAIESAHLKNAVVIATPYTTGFSDVDLPTNLPLDLYPDQDYVIAIDKQTPREAAACLHYEFPGRVFYSASGSSEVQVTWSQY